MRVTHQRSVHDVVLAQHTRPRRLSRIVVVILGSYLGLTLLLFAPVLAHLTTAIAIGSSVGEIDGWQNVWMLWSMHQAVATAHDPFWTTLIFYPTGTGLFWQTLNSPAGVLALPITTWLNAIAAFNLSAMATFVLGGFCMYLLAYRLVASHRAAWVAGLLFAFSPFHLTKLYDGQLEVMTIQYCPLFVLCVLNAFDRGRWRWVGLASLMLIVITLTSLYYGLFSLIYLALYTGVTLLRHRRWPEVRQIVARGLMICVPLLLLLFFHLRDTRPGILPDWQLRQILHSATPLDLFLPSPYNPLWGPAVHRVQAALHGGDAQNLSGGLAVVGLAVCGSVWRRRLVTPWLVLALLLFTFAMGPFLVLGASTTTLRLPFWLLDQLSVGRSGQRPNHLVVYVSTVFCCVAAYGWHAMAQRLGQRWQGTLLITTCLVLALDLWPSAITPAVLAASPFYASVAAEADQSGAILELPLRNRSSLSLQGQLQHHHPIVDGYLARSPGDDFATYTDGIRQLCYPNQPPETLLYPDWTAALVPALAAYNIEYVVVYRNQYERPALQRVTRILDDHLQRVYQDPAMLAYRRPGTVLPSPLVSLRRGWYPVQGMGTAPEAWTQPKAEFVIMNPATTTQPILLRFTYARLQRNQFMTLERAQGRTWQTITTVPPSDIQRSYDIALWVAPGETELRFSTAGTALGKSYLPRRGAGFTQVAVLPSG